jgi:4-hydroxy-tetrahydrodipicolinate reductase
MKIALLGYGKMGQIIERIATERGHEIVVRKSIDDTFAGIENAEIAIEFSAPDAAIENITKCFEIGIPVVSGTTGWLERYDEMVVLCNQKSSGMIYSSNYSLGVNLFFDLNEKLAVMMSKFKQYKVAMEEIHHIHKLDAPSGTAITLAEGVIKNSDYSNWTLEQANQNQIHIEAKRVGEVPGTHAVFYDSEIDSIEIKHTAHNREGFALGAVVAAEWLLGKKGVFSMRDVLR